MATKHMKRCSAQSATRETPLSTHWGGIPKLQMLTSAKKPHSMAGKQAVVNVENCLAYQREATY